uniref:Saposin B-type domain-containing protein n=1 Tax=Zooxanthella nutricula TaxID=1333877 RepID=A0A6V0G723_9DINO|mmetsp:Transcript_50440/g.153391  ORF Transcript_50440/g.153391 Transcript_50440/m.153391 type:complete len:235 (+) Transcript_50440:91-795(+)
MLAPAAGLRRSALPLALLVAAAGPAIVGAGNGKGTSKTPGKGVPDKKREPTVYDPHSPEAMALADKFKRQQKAGTDPLSIHESKAYACSACEMVADRFRYRVAKKIKGKTSAKKTAAFMANLEAACERKGYPTQVAMGTVDGKDVYVDYRHVLNGNIGMNLKKIAPELTDDMVSNCKYLLFGPFQDALLQRVLDLRDPRDVNYRPLLCGPGVANVCELPARRKGEDEDEDESEL